MSTVVTRMAVIGAGGRMGRAIVRIVAETRGAVLAAACERAGQPVLGQDAGVVAGIAASGIPISDALPARGAADVWIDFTTPAATMLTAQAAADAGAALVVGTTGLSPEQRAQIAALGARVPIVLAPNMSVGINVMLDLVARAARALGPEYDLEVVEAHHRAKRDAPSGTALRIAEVLAEATGRDLGETARYERHGDIGPRSDAEIGIQTIRGGDVVGDHTVYFLGIGERIEITHRASSRDILAKGAVRAALWVPGRPAGLYDMRDVLGGS